MPDSGIHSEGYLAWFDKHGKARPFYAPHGTEEDIRKQMKQLLPNTWQLEGNRLSGMTSMGKLVVYVPTDVILTGTDPKGLPIFKKIQV